MNPFKDNITKYKESALKYLIDKYNVKIFEPVDSEHNTLFHNKKYSEDFIEWNLARHPRVNILNVKNKYGQTIFHVHRYSEEFIQRCLLQTKTKIFDVKDIFGNTIFHERKYNEWFLKWCLEKYNVSLVDTGNDEGYSILHAQRYSENFLKQYPINYLEHKNMFDDTIFHEHKYSEGFIKECLEQSPDVNLLTLKGYQNLTIFHTHKYSEEFLKWCFERDNFNTSVFSMKGGMQNSINSIIFEFSSDFIEYCNNLWP